MAVRYTVYRVDDNDFDATEEGADNGTHARSKKRALQMARERAAGLAPEYAVTVERLVVGGDTALDLVLRLLDGRAYVEERTVVATLSGREMPPPCGECGEPSNPAIANCAWSGAPPLCNECYGIADDDEGRAITAGRLTT